MSKACDQDVRGSSWRKMFVTLLLLIYDLPGVYSGGREGGGVFRRGPRSHSPHVANELVDIGVISACVKDKFHRFIDRVNFEAKGKWKRRIRFLLLRYKCTDPSNEIPYDFDNIKGYPAVVADSKTVKFTRSTYINQLHDLVRPNARLLVVDIDLRMTDSVLTNVVNIVSPGTVYFPIMWGVYSPKHLARVEKELKTSVEPFSQWHGIWLTYSYGMFAIHAKDLPHCRMNESFVGWGGEDVEFHGRLKHDPRITVVRENERGLIHTWHQKNCTQIVENPRYRISCLGSKYMKLGCVAAQLPLLSILYWLVLL